MIETDEHQIFRKTLRDLFEREIEPHIDAWEAARTFPAHELFPKLGAVGLLGLEYEEAYGGMGADHSFTLIAGEEMGRIGCGGVPMAMAVQMSMATPALARYGSAELKERYLAPSIRGEHGGVHRRDRARRRQRRGRHPHPGGAATATSGSSTGRSSTSPTGPRPIGCACWPARRRRTGTAACHSSWCRPRPTASSSPASSRSWACGRATRRSSRSPTSGCRSANTIGEIGRGFQQQMVQFQAERLITVYKQVGSIELALQRTKAYLIQRQAFGKPLMANQHLQFVAGRIVGPPRHAQALPRAAADAVRRGEDATRFATIGKLMGSRLQREVADTCVQFHGGIAYMDEHWASRFYRDTRLDSIGAGADEVMLRILARMDGYASRLDAPGRVSGRGDDDGVPFAAGSISLRLYPHNELPAPEVVAELCAQARLGLSHGFDGIMTSEHHGGFPGYLPNPLQMVTFVLEENASGWAAACPLLLPLRPTALVAEEVAWLAARHPGRVGVGVAAGALPLDFEAMGVAPDSAVADVQGRAASTGRSAARPRPRRSGWGPGPAPLRRAPRPRAQRRRLAGRRHAGRARAGRAS